MCGLNHFVVLVLAVCLTGCCHTARTVNPAPLTTSQGVPKEGRIEVGDVLKVRLTDYPSPLIREVMVPVESTGMITLPFDVTVTAAGKTIPALAVDIRNAYVPKHFVHLTMQIEAMRQERPIRVGDDLTIIFTDIPP